MTDEREREQSAEQEGTRRPARLALVAGAIGSVLGAGAALLLSPWRGAETRERLRGGASKFGATAREKARSAMDRVKERAASRSEERED